MKRATSIRFGFTLIELMTVVIIVAVAIIGMTSVIADAQRGHRQMYERVFGDVVSDAYATRRAFDRVVRKSSIRYYMIDDDPSAVSGNTSVTVYYYDDPQTSLVLDKYCRFEVAGTELAAYYGDLVPGTFNPQGSETRALLAQNVTYSEFSVTGMGVAVRMMLKLDNQKQQMSFTTTALRHNDWE
jgi:prepilin-type N-terminal cleavage/methylation domain-containing protein